MKIKLKQMKLKYYLILFFVLLCSINLNAQNNLNRITGLSSTTASVAYSLRQLSTAYTGPLVRIKVNSSFYDVYPDATTYNFTLSSKISASISTYDAAVSAASGNALSSIITAGTTNATVAIWYDQSGNAVNVLSSTSSPGAKIITAGSINTIFGQPTIYFSGSNSDFLGSSSTVDYSALSGATVNAVAQNVATASSYAGIIGTAAGDTRPGYNISYSSPSSGYGSDGDGCFYGTSVTSTDIKVVTNIFIFNTKNRSKIYVNNELKTNVAVTSSGNCLLKHTSDSKIFIGVSRGFGKPTAFIGNISEAIIIPGQLSDEVRNPLETNQTQTYLGPSVTITSSASGAVCAGTNVVFTAVASNISTPTYQWYANGTAISGATSSTYSSTSLTNGVQINVKVTEGYSEGAIVTNGLRFNLDAGNSASYAGSGTRWTDLSGNGNHGTLSGATLPTHSPDNGGSFVFNGSNSNVNLNKNASAIDIYDKSYTADAWVYPTDLGGDRGMFGDEQAASRQGLHLIFRGGSIHQGHFASDANIGSVTTNSWWHIVFTFDKATGATKMYKNGVDQGNSGTIGSYIGTSNIHLGQGYGNSGYFQGKGAVYKMYDRVLSSAEVTTNYNALSNRFGLTGVAQTVVNSTSITTTVNPVPAIPVITVNGDRCINKTSLTTPSGLTSYVWYKDDVIISDITTNTLTPNASGDYKVVVSNGTCSNTSSVTTIYSCGKTSEGKMSPITSSTTLVAISGKINSTYGVDERGLILNSITPVTTGLILYLDAGNLSSYSGSGTNWTDLSDRGNNGTLVGGVTYNSSNQGSLVFNGNSSGTTDSYVSLPATTDFAFGSGDFTVEMWIYANSGNNVSTFISINSSSGYAALRLENYLSNNLDAFHSSDGASHLIGKMSTSITANKWTHLVFSRINGNAKIYLDGVEKLSYALVGSLVASGNSRIGSLPGFTDRNHSGNIAITRIYKGKGLTSTEVTTQFDLLKSRFGL